jgi:hypothetical protein
VNFSQPFRFLSKARLFIRLIIFAKDYLFLPGDELSKTADKVKVGLATLGCKVNQYESAALAEDLHNKDFSLVLFNSRADVYIINTCTITAFSDFQARQCIRRAHRTNLQAKIIVTGCYAQIASADIAKLDGVNLVVDNDQKNMIPELRQNGRYCKRYCHWSGCDGRFSLRRRR